MVKKIVLTIVLVAVLAGAGLWAGATWLFGAGVESALRGTPDPEATHDLLHVRHEVERGFLSSKAKTWLTFSEDELGTDGMPGHALALNHEVFHGPLALTPDGPVPCSNYAISTLDLETHPEAVRNLIATIFQGEPPLVLRTTMGLSRSATSRLTLAPAIWEDPEGSGGRIEFDGADITLSAVGDDAGGITSAVGVASIGGWRASWTGGKVEAQPGNGTFDYRDAQSLKGQLTLGAVTTAIPDGTLRIGSLLLEIDQQRASERAALFLGDSRIELTELSFASEAGNIGIKNALIQANSGNTDGKLIGKVKYGVGELSVPPILAGPMAPFLPAVQKGFSVEVGGSGFDLATIETLMEHAQKMQTAQIDAVAAGSSGSGSALANSPAYREALVDYLNGVLDLFAPGIAVTQRLEIAGATGTSHADLKLGLGGEEPLRQHSTLRSLIASLSGELSLHVSKSDLPAEQVAAMSAGLTASGLLVEEATAITGMALLGDGQLRVNGQPTPLIESLGEMLDQPIEWEKIFDPLGSL